MVLVVNTSFNELNHLAAGLADADLLSAYVRPYANLGRAWERWAARLLGGRRAYARSFGRRNLPYPLGVEHVREAGLPVDFIMAVHARLPRRTLGDKVIRGFLVHSLVDAVGQVAAKTLVDERAVVASWRCAQPGFERMKARGGLCILNYPLAHHHFSRRYLLEEADLEPTFATTLNSHNRPRWETDRLEREIVLADYVLVGSNFVRDTFVEEGVPRHKLEVIPYGADTSLFRPREVTRKRENTFNIVFAGQLSQRKGLSYLLRAYERIRGAGTSLTLVGALQDNGAALRPWAKLFYHIPYVSRMELATIFQQADVFVFPTLIEGMPLVVVEAMASGLPVIATPNGPGDIVRDGIDGFLVPPRNVDAIVMRLEQLRADPVLREKMAQNARSRSQEFSWQHYRRAAINKIVGWLDGTNVASRI